MKGDAGEIFNPSTRKENMSATAFTVLALFVALSLAIGIPTFALFTQQQAEHRDQLRRIFQTRTSGRPYLRAR